MKKIKLLEKIVESICCGILFIILIPVFIFLLLSGLALYVFDKKNKGLGH